MFCKPPQQTPAPQKNLIKSKSSRQKNIIVYVHWINVIFSLGLIVYFVKKTPNMKYPLLSTFELCFIKKI